MLFQLNKWYLDFTSPQETGYYYIISFHAGWFKLGFSAIRHLSQHESISSNKICRLTRESFHKLETSNAELSISPGSVDLHIRHGQTGLKGQWRFEGQPIKMRQRPLYRTTSGWCDWTVWTPLAQARISLNQKGREHQLFCSGYIDFVRFAFPFWKVPFKKLYWGRLHSKDKWIILFLLETPHSRIGIYADREMISEKLTVKIIRDKIGHIQSIDWEIDHLNSGEKNPLLIHAEVTHLLDSQELLNSAEFLRLMPRRLRRTLASSGIEEKVGVQAMVNGLSYRGIMEEVNWPG